ncbi:MAG: response regulator [Paludibacter sp.]|jgi:PAS domain S-box-containing protein|nr:response regulator [Paludibacter sp.]
MKEVIRKILVIDDNPDNLISLKALIADLFRGFITYTATSGTEGIELARKHSIDVILLDVLMPVMDGFETCKLLKSDPQLNDIPVVFVTALKEDRTNKVRALEAGGEGFLTKPVDEQELVAQLNTMLKLKEANDFKRFEIERLEQMVSERTRQLQEEYQRNSLLNESHMKLSQAVEQSPASVVITTTAGIIEYVNPKFTSVTGYTYNEVLGKNPRILKSGHQSQEFYKELWDTISSGKEWMGEFHNKKKNGELYWELARISPIKNEDGTIINYLATKEDITELMQAEKNYRLSIDQSPIGIRIVNQQGKTVYANEAFLAIYEYTSLSEYVSTPAKVRYTEESYLEHVERKKIRKAGGEANEYEISIRRLSGEIRYIKVWWKEVLWDREKHFQVINQDITQEKLLYNDLVNAKNKAEESDRLKSAFLANMSHEIRTPMNGILGFAELLKEPDLTGDQQRMYIDLINKSGQRMLNIIKDIIDISKIESGVMEIQLSDININEQFEFIHHFFLSEATAKGLQLKVRNLPADRNVRLTTDKEKLYAVLTNLVKNALKFTSRGEIELGCIHKESYLEFFVRDTGIGIAKDRQQAVFERFVQADIEDKMAFQGAGLGLTISKNYVEMLGGTIWLESTEGVGTTFYFTLPVNFGAPLAQPDVRSAQPVTISETRKLKILIVEDDEVSAMLLKKSITSVSNELLFATNGVDAIQKCRDNSDIDLILMDIRMPVMGGYEATRQIRQFNPNVIIIAQTAFGLAGDREKAREAGCNDYVSKPINIAELKNKIASLLPR